MKKKALLVMAIGVVLFGTVVISHALPFTSVADFAGTGTDAGRTYLEIGDNSSLFIYNYSHNVSFDPAAASITSATITLSHKGNSNNNGELWFLYEGSAVKIQQLSGSTFSSDWVDEVITLPPSLFSAISGGSWSLALSLQETTPGTDELWIDKSVLSGEYDAVTTPSNPPSVPEPASMLLLGFGLVGLAGIRRKFNS
jgi:hypothetical protein